MTPLSDALTTAQRRALAALEKAYVAGELDPDPDDAEALSGHDSFAERLASFGITDKVDVAFLCASLDVLREWGVNDPTMTERVAATVTGKRPMWRCKCPRLNVGRRTSCADCGAVNPNA